MTINAANRSVAINVGVDGVRRSKYPQGMQYLAGPALKTLSGDEESHGAVYVGSSGSRMTYSNVRAFSGAQSMAVQLLYGLPPGTCGGSHAFGGRFNLPTLIPEGYNIWFKAHFYLPSILSMGYVFGTGDSAEAAECGKFADGSTNLKWLVLAQDNSTQRLYLELRNQRRNAALTNGFKLISEPGGGAPLSYTGSAIPLDEWFALQLQIYVHSSAGFLRGWLNETYVGQHDRATLSDPSYKIKEWGLGNYWNGVPWDNGSGADTLYIDEVIIATDYPGYGAPMTVDSGGRPYIPPTATVADVV